MNGFSSQYSSGCESGWTTYLEQSSLSQRNGGFAGEDYKREEEEEVDLSMVSDASSGPPHFLEDGYFDKNGVFCSVSSPSALTKKSDKKRRTQGQNPSILDDTASSPVFNFSEEIIPEKEQQIKTFVQNNFTLNNTQATMENFLDFSQGFSATHYKEKSTYQNHIGFLKSSLPGNPSSARPVICREKSGKGMW